MTKKRIVQVGLGGWGWSWVDIVIGSPQWELVGIVDRDRGVLNRAIQLHGLDPAAQPIAYIATSSPPTSEQ